MIEQTITGKYRLERLLGRGGMGEVWEARDLVLDRLVALKLMALTHFDMPRSRKRFELEAMALAKLSNEHIVAVFDYGIFEDNPYIVMESLHGEDLEARLRRVQQLSPRAVLDHLTQITKGLIAAAEVGVVHRDLKPANIFIARGSTSETLKILDFGLAWMRAGSDEASPQEHGRLMGTPVYMSPEQIRGRSPDPSNDLWSLAVIAYRALTGQLPFRAKVLSDLVVSICTDPITLPSSLAPELAGFDAFFERALAKDKQARFPSAHEFLRAFEQQCMGSQTTQILVVDDEPAVHDLMRIRFRKEVESATYAFSFASDGHQALDELSRNSNIDVILLDINMPGMDGLTLLGQVPKVSPLAKAVMVTAYDDMTNIRRAMNHGAFDFLVKPIRMDDLRTTIDKTANAARECRALATSERRYRILNQFTNPALLARLADDPALGLVSEHLEVTVVHVEIREDVPTPGTPPSQAARSLNAVLEVVVSELAAAGGNIDTLTGSTLSAVFTGPVQVETGLRAATRVGTQLSILTRRTGAYAPYGRGVAIGISTGTALAACVGSHACSRLSYAVIGEAVETAKTLSGAAKPGEVLVCSRVRDACPTSFQFTRVDTLPSERRVEPSFRVSEAEVIQQELRALLDQLTATSEYRASETTM